jgi:putative heme-binding domain-containing protein
MGLPHRFQNSTIGSYFSGFAACLLLSICNQLSFAQELGDHQYTTQAIEVGSRLYVSQCALCHGPQGALVDGINLRRGQFRTVTSDDDLRRVISSGAAAGQMPAFDLGPDEMEGVIAYIRAGFDPDGIAVRIGDPVRGKAIFEGEGECSGCHRVNGMGPRTAPDLSDIGAIRTPASLQRNLLDPATALLPINRPVRIVTQNEETIVGRRLNEDTYTVQIMNETENLVSIPKAGIEEIIKPKMSLMPEFDESFTDSEVNDLVAYLYSLEGEMQND